MAWLGNIIEQPADETAKKLEFAVELLRSPAEPFKAALAVYPEDTNKALKVANQWTSDPLVIAEVKRLKDEEGELSFLPTKAELARQIWDNAATAVYKDDKAKLFKLYAEVMGFIDGGSKGGPAGARGGTNGMTPAQVFATPLDESI